MDETPCGYGESTNRGASDGEVYLRGLGARRRPGVSRALDSEHNSKEDGESDMKQVDNYKSGQIGRHYIAAEPLRCGWTVAMPSAFGRRSMAFKHIFALPQLGFALLLMVKPVVGSEAVFTLTVSNAASVSDASGVVVTRCTAERLQLRER